MAFLIVSPPVYLGAWILFLARDHLDEDAMKIFQAVVRALEQDAERTRVRTADATPDLAPDAGSAQVSGSADDDAD